MKMTVWRDNAIIGIGILVAIWAMWIFSRAYENLSSALSK